MERRSDDSEQQPVNRIFAVGKGEFLAVITPDKRMFKCVVDDLLHRTDLLHLSDLGIVDFLSKAHPDTVAKYGIPQANPKVGPTEV